MRLYKISALAAACVAGGLALAQAEPRPGEAPRGPQGGFERMCSADGQADRAKRAEEMSARRVTRMATILQLNDAQKAALKDVEDFRAKQRADNRTALCAAKPDLSALPGRLAFREQAMQRRLDSFKAEEPKLLAFYNSLDAKQKAAFDALRERGPRPGGPGAGPRPPHDGPMGGPMGGPHGGPDEGPDGGPGDEE